MTEQTNAYWDTRFSTDWEARHGKEQTAYFADLIINNINPRVLYETNSALDWGCALGQLCDKWAYHTGTKDVVGYDFSKTACSHAKELFPQIEFVTEPPKRRFDVVITSNFLEHVLDPLAYINRFANMADMYIVCLCPYKNRVFDEHVTSISDEHFPDEVLSFVKIQQKIIQCNEPLYWTEKQILVVYKKTR